MVVVGNCPAVRQERGMAPKRSGRGCMGFQPGLSDQRHNAFYGQNLNHNSPRGTVVAFVLQGRDATCLEGACGRRRMAFSKCRSRFIARRETVAAAPSSNRMGWQANGNGRRRAGWQNRQCVHLNGVCRVVPSSEKIPVGVAGRQNHRPSFVSRLPKGRDLSFFAAPSQEI